MKKDDLEFFVGKLIRIRLKSGFHFSGSIQELKEDSILFLDKFQKTLRFDLTSIESVEELGGLYDQ